MSENPQFLKSFLNIQGDLLAYILCMGVEPASAEDVLQDAAMVMLKKFDQFEAGTNFRAWAYAVVRYEVLKKREWQGKQPMCLSEDALDSLESRALSTESVNIRLEALTHCLNGLPEKARTLVRLRYDGNLGVQAIAARLRRPIDSVYTTLSKIRKGLQECIHTFESREAKVS